MPDAISALDLVSWTLAISSDEAKNARLKEIEAELAVLNDTKTQADAAAKQAAADLAAATKLKAQFDSQQYGLKIRADELDAREKTLAELNTAIHEEKVRFQAVRDDIQAAQKMEIDRLTQQDAALTQWAIDIGAREKDTAQKAAAAEALHEEAKAKIAALITALATVAPPPEPEPPPKPAAKSAAKSRDAA